jgi:DNA-binding CsgD family transcriptional regulator
VSDERSKQHSFFHGGGEPRGAAARLGRWLAGLAVPAWIVNRDQVLLGWNDAAGRLLGLDRSSRRAVKCHDVVGTTDAAGRPTCRRDCDVMRDAAKDRPVAPRVVRVGALSRPRWLQLVYLPVEIRGHEPPCLLHYALDADRHQQMESYLSRVARRCHAEERTWTRRPLTQREQDVLDLLCRDQDLPAIAQRLQISHATVRNHVQHILAKLEVHSVEEAAALHVLALDEPEPPER